MKIGKPSRRMIRWTAGVIAGFALLLGGGFATLWYSYPLPNGMLHAGPPGALALDKSGGTLLDITGNDEQRRLPISIDDAGDWIPLAVIAAEDQEYLTHCGIDIPAMVRAVWQNLRMGRVVRGASTITMLAKRPRRMPARTPPATKTKAGWIATSVIVVLLPHE